jgi:regulator of RNase E activity RraB
MAKKEANKGKWHVLGTVNRDGSGILTALGEFINGNKDAQVSPEEEKAMINYTFDRALRLKTVLANARIELKPPSQLETFKATVDQLAKIKKEGFSRYLGGKSIIEDLKEQAQRTQEASQRNTRLQNAAAHGAVGKDFVNEAIGTVSSVPAGQTAIASAQAAATPAVISAFETWVANALKVAQDAAFAQMISAATAVVGQANYKTIIGLVPILNTVVAAGQVAKGFADAATAYQQKNECRLVRKEIAAPGDPQAAFAALEKLLDEDFKAATQAAVEGAVAFAAGFDATGTASTVVGAVTAVAHLFQDMVTFGLNYYQMLAANRILISWQSTPLDGDESIAFGLRSTSGVSDEIKARRAVGGVQTDNFTAAMGECPLLGCYFLSKLPAIDLLEIVSADVAYHYKSSFFQMHIDVDSGRVSNLVASAESILDASRFKISQEQSSVFEMRKRIEEDNLKRHAEFVAGRQLALESAVVMMLARRKKDEDDRAAELAELVRRSEEVELAKLLARREAIAKAMAIYKAETGGIHKLHTVRNSESTEARAVMKGLIEKGTDKQTLITLEAVASYLLTITGKPREYPALMPLRDASRLKRLIKEHYDKAP